MDSSIRKFLWIWLISCAVLCAVVISYNTLVNPYMVLNVPRIAGFNARKPAIETHAHLMKAYDVLRSNPNAVLLGTSTVGLGLDAQNSAWPAEFRPVYNLSIRGGGPYTSYRYLQHIAVQKHISLVVMGLDFQFFLNVPDPLVIGPEFELRLSVTAKGDVNTEQKWQYVRDLLRETLSLDGLDDSTTTVLGNLEGDSTDIIAGNWRNSEYFRFASREGWRWVAFWDRRLMELYAGKQVSPFAMNNLRSILALCKANGTRVILFLSPMHAHELEAIRLSGSWAIFEQWKRDLVTLTADFEVPLWDFSDFDRYSTEPVPTDGSLMHWFRDSTHYTPDLGNLIAKRLFGGNIPGFGVLLTAKNINEHLAMIRARQRQYHVPSEVGEMPAVFTNASKSEK